MSALAAVVIAGLAYGGWIWWLYRDAERTMRDPSLDEVIDEPPDHEEPFFALLVGSDSREGLTEEEQQQLGADDSGLGSDSAIDPADTSPGSCAN